VNSGDTKRSKELKKERVTVFKYSKGEKSEGIRDPSKKRRYIILESKP